MVMMGVVVRPVEMEEVMVVEMAEVMVVTMGMMTLAAMAVETAEEMVVEMAEVTPNTHTQLSAIGSLSQRFSFFV